MLTGKAAAPIVLLAGIAVHVTVYAALSIAANFKAIAEFKRLYSVTIAGQS
ncbi:MAG: hypothetical protein GTO41_28120 [Burkholderiales bacterium]|nr:hypothetical protein [Burkholderiales bacterium]